MEIELKHIKKSTLGLVILDDISLTFKSGQLVALLGPSGSGKTTLLRLIAGLEYPDSGSILFDGKEVQASNIKERNIGFVFQQYALFNHMSVFENIAFGLQNLEKSYRPTKDEIKKRVIELLQLVHLEVFYDRYPHQLSGGQQQRVALIRALAPGPSVLLLDEPFGALDTKVRKELRRWMRKLHDEINVTSVFVTHDQEEAMEVADHVVVMNNGKIIQQGTPEQVWHFPANSFVYDFLGNFNQLDGWIDDKEAIYLNEVNKPIHAKAIKLYARPHEIYITKICDEQEYLIAEVTNINLAGALVKIELECVDSHKLIQVEMGQLLFEKQHIQRFDTVYVRPIVTRVFED